MLASVIASDAGSRSILLSIALFLAAAACGTVGISPRVSTAVVLVGLGGGCLTLPLRWSIVAAASAWASITGLVVNTAGRLTTDADDLRRAAACVLVAAVVSLLRPGRRHREA